MKILLITLGIVMLAGCSAKVVKPIPKVIHPVIVKQVASHYQYINMENSK